jgi:hypothetical protein
MTGLPLACGSRIGRFTLRPTISSASSAAVVLRVLRSAAIRPPRSTTTRSDAAITSCSLWLMKMMESPLAVMP